MNAHTHARTLTDSHSHTHTHARTHAHAHTHTHTPVAYQGNQGNETEEKVFKKRKVFNEDLKELTEVEWRTETGNWFQITGALDVEQNGNGNLCGCDIKALQCNNVGKFSTNNYNYALQSLTYLSKQEGRQAVSWVLSPCWTTR